VETSDTNVVVRLAVHDDEIQSRDAEIAWRRALATGGVFLPKVVLVETAWVLRAAYRFDNSTVATTWQ
jgi:predicted nucleic-acid-binding protein